MIISPFTPIFFIERKKRSGIDRAWSQIFSKDDEILIQILRSSAESIPVGRIIDAKSDMEISTIKWTSAEIGESEKMDYCVITGLDTGCYYIRLDNKCSDPFIITSSEAILENTVLIQYSPIDNRARRDVVPLVGNKRLFFSFRVQGGFKDSGWSFSVDNEQFVTDMADIVELYGRESTQKTLTVGNSSGVPIWVGQMLNRILTCHYVYIDGVRFSRFESSVPQKEQIMECVNCFVFTQNLQEIKYVEPHITDVV